MKIAKKLAVAFCAGAMLLGACGGGGDAYSKMAADYEKAVCACKDTKCAQAAAGKMAETSAKLVKDKVKPTEAGMKASKASIEKATECAKKLATKKK